MNEQMLTPREVAETLKVSPMTVYRLIRDGKMKAFRVGSSYRIKPTDLDSYLTKNSVTP